MSPLPLSVRALRYVATLVFATLLGACGSSSRVEDYVPTRIMSFGDELSVIKSDGSKYTVNGFTSGTTIPNCTVNPIWNQALATSFGLAFPICKPDTIAIANGAMNAAQGATVDAVAVQVNAVATGEFVPATLVTIQAGLWDIVSAYNAFKTSGNRDGAVVLVQAAGVKLAGLVNQITNNGTGARVIYATVPDLSFAPLAFTEQATAGACAIDCKVFLKQLSDAFNEALRINVKNDGRYAALVEFDDLLRSMATTTLSVGTYGLVNNTTALTVAACTPADTSLCTPATLVAEATAAANPSAAYLWASDRLPGPAWHAQVATRAITRARNNPF